ncbi:MAG: phosphoribosylformylglycinamidine synthase I [Chloroflexi bacterium]|nr:phosphoribosylformylglycinamidine synthase I [Chloroflexota bacterium]
MSPTPRVLILHAPGTNRDREAALACQLAGGAPEIVHINQLAAGARALEDYQMLVLPGGFSYGDDLGAGRLWANDLFHRFRASLDAFVAAGKPVMGICNGFQALVKAGYLPGPAPRQRVTLTNNRQGHFECRWVRLRIEAQSACLFTRGLEEDILCPVAHGEGRLALPDEDERVALWREGLVALTYVQAPGDDRAGRTVAVASQAGYPANPNGSVDDIAGLCNAAGNVFGLMPHPEDHVLPEQHPRWTRGQAGGMGIGLFRNGVQAAGRFL